MTTAVLEDYRLARAAQDARYDGVMRGAAVGTRTEEYARYYGTGEHRGGGVEQRVTLRRFLEQTRRPEVDDTAPPVVESSPWASETAAPGVSAELAFTLSGAALAELAAAGVSGAAEEISRRAVKRAAKRAARHN